MPVIKFLCQSSLTLYILPYDDNKKFKYDHRDLNYFNNYYINKRRNKIKHIIIDDSIIYGENVFKKKLLPLELSDTSSSSLCVLRASARGLLQST